MKKIIFITILTIILGGLIWLGVYYWRAVKPVVSQPAANISRLLEQTDNIKDNLADYNQQIKEQLDEEEVNKESAVTEYYQPGPLTLPKGFTIATWAEGLDTPRVIVHGPNGGLLVSLPNQGKVVKVQDRDGDGKAEEKKTVVSGLNRPHGLHVKCDSETNCQLYVAETDKVSLFDYDFASDTAINKRKIIDLPSGGGHWTRTIMETPLDGKDKTELLISVGSSCNVCEEADWRRAKILIADLDGSNLREYAAGLRNSVFMTIHPVSGEIWATDMGRDWLGDNLPPEEVNIIKQGNDYGWPICYGNKTHDFEFDKRQYIVNPCQSTIAPHLEYQAHSAPLGLAFVPEEGWPPDMWYDLLVAFHGSWNRSEPTGYKVVRFNLDSKGNLISQEDFISGWLQADGSALGRPVAILIEPGGVIYISDDKAGVIYRVLYGGN